VSDARSTLPLPPHPNLEQQRKRARELLNAARAHDPEAIRRIAAVHPGAGSGRPRLPAAALSLHAAQLVIAREYGFASWTRLKARIDAISVTATLQRYADDTKRILFTARFHAGQFGRTAIDPEHVLLSLTQDRQHLAGRILGQAGVSTATVSAAIERRTTAPLPPLSPSARVPFSEATRRVLRRAAEEADRLSHAEVRPEHLLLGILGFDRSVASSILGERGLRLRLVREAVMRMLEEEQRLSLPASLAGQDVGLAGVGATALAMAANRALETASETPLFSDPLADALSGEAGRRALSLLGGVGGGRSTGPYAYLSIRHRFFDDALLHAIRNSRMTQAVILGAGMDARAFRLDWPPGLALYEVDRAEVLDYKQTILERLEARGLCERRVVRADLTGPWTDRLIASGFDSTRPAAILAEGVLHYLTEADVMLLLRAVARIASEGSWLGFDLCNREMLTLPVLAGVRKGLEELGCPWRFGTSEPEKLLADHGWRATVHSPGDPDANFGRWPLPFIPRSLPGIPRNFFVQATMRSGRPAE
jgi:methyltransferase (TIGR00027 family)